MLSSGVLDHDLVSEISTQIRANEEAKDNVLEDTSDSPQRSTSPRKVKKLGLNQAWDLLDWERSFKFGSSAVETFLRSGIVHKNAEEKR